MKCRIGLDVVASTPYLEIEMFTKVAVLTLRAALNLLGSAYPEDAADAWNNVTTTVASESNVDWHEITARENGTEYLNQVWRTSDGELTICEAYTREVGQAQWSHLFSDESCTDIPTL